MTSCDKAPSKDNEAILVVSRAFDKVDMLSLGIDIPSKLVH